VLLVDIFGSRTNKTMNTIKLYLAMSLSGVTSEQERQEIRQLLVAASSIPGVQFLKWAFDVEKWGSEPVNNIFEYDTIRLLEADLAVFIWWNSVGSDGRGGELIARLLSGRPTIIVRQKGVFMSRFSHHGIDKSFVLPIETVDNVEHFKLMLWRKVWELRNNPESFAYKVPDYLADLLRRLVK
jgi:hypothetical protein